RSGRKDADCCSICGRACPGHVRLSWRVFLAEAIIQKSKFETQNILVREDPMYRGFPASAFDLLRCPRDGGSIYGAFDAEFVQTGSVSCRQCATSYPIEEGIVRLLDPDTLDRVSQENRVVFEHNSAADGFEQESTEESQAEIASTMKALAPLEGCRV